MYDPTMQRRIDSKRAVTQSVASVEVYRKKNKTNGAYRKLYSVKHMDNNLKEYFYKKKKLNKYLFLYKK